MNGLILDIASKDLTYNTTPQYPGETPPIVFALPIDVGMSYSVSCTERSTGKTYLYQYSINFKAFGYANNGQYPHFIANNATNSNVIFSWNVATFSGISEVSGSYDYYIDGALQQHADITGSNMTNYNTLQRNPSVFTGFTLTISYCSIPLIYEVSEGEYYGRSVFEDLSISSGYNITRTLNMKEADQEEKTYEFSTIARNYTMDEFGNLTENESEGERYRGLRIKIKGLASLYKIPGISDGNLKYGIKLSTTPVICYYSNDYGNTWQNVPGQPTILPFDFIWRPYEEEDGEGAFWASVGEGDNKNLYIFDNEDDASEYISGQSDGRKASNYGKITSGDFNNPTGEEDEETEFGEVKTRGFFSQQYIMDSTCLQALANDLFDTSAGGLWEEIAKGLGMYGDNPIEAVMGLSFWPVDLTSVFTGVSAAHIWFGGYGWEPSAGSALRLTYPNGYKTLGSIAIRRAFRNWRDYAPYTRLYVSLPYVGVYELDLTRYYDKTVEVRYYFDTRTNGCIACLIADGHLMDYFNGQMGVTMPITLTDYAGYANSQIATLLGAGALAAGAAGVMAAGVVGLGAAGAGLAGTAIGTSGIAGAAAAAGSALNFGGAGAIMASAPIAGAALGAKTVYGLSQNNINKHNVTKGGSSSMINEYLPQYVEFIFEIQEDCAPDNYGQQYGYPSMKSGSVGSFQGFLKCQSVKLDCGVATENEKNQIKTMLLNGIYI